MRWTHLLLVPLLLLGSPVRSRPQPSEDYRIVPGERIGIYRLGMPYESVVALWGENDLGAGRYRKGCPGQRFAWTTKPMGYNAEFWEEKLLIVGIYSSTHLYYAERDALATKYQTEKGVRLGSSFEDVRRAHGRADQEGQTIGILWRYRTGIHFLFTWDQGHGKVFEISVAPMGTEFRQDGLLSCRAVLLGDDFTIVPGERVGALRLSQSMDEILELVGEPSREWEAGQTTYAQWYGLRLQVGRLKATGEISEIATFWTGEPNPYRTESGLSIGTTLEQARAFYGTSGCERREGETWLNFEWPERGLVFQVWKNERSPQMAGKVTFISVRKPRPSSTRASACS